MVTRSKLINLTVQVEKSKSWSVVADRRKSNIRKPFHKNDLRIKLPD
jgi:hypothetical protein